MLTLNLYRPNILDRKIKFSFDRTDSREFYATWQFILCLYVHGFQRTFGIEIDGPSQYPIIFFSRVL